MTCQVPERIYFEGQLLSMSSEPLQKILPPVPAYGMSREDPTFPYPFDVSCTALWRGYVGRWKVEDGRLYLVAIAGQASAGGTASISNIFPNADGPVFADWYTGTLSIERGQVIGRVDGYYMNVHEESVILKVKSGVVVSKKTRRNNVPQQSD